MVTETLLPRILNQFALDPRGPHGLAHWARVYETAQRLARDRDVNPHVLELFALLHDARRVSDGEDRDHGLRGGALALHCRRPGCDLDDVDFSRLHAAIVGHDQAWGDPGDETIRICWDAERLDLPRLGLTARASRLFTDAARDPALIEWAGRRSRAGHVPRLVETRWKSSTGMATATS